MNKNGIILLQGKELDIVDSMLTPESMVDENIEDSFKKLKQIQEQDKEHRVQYLLDMADQYAMENNNNK